MVEIIGALLGKPCPRIGRAYKLKQAYMPVSIYSLVVPFLTDVRILELMSLELESWHLCWLGKQFNRICPYFSGSGFYLKNMYHGFIEEYAYLWEAGAHNEINWGFKNYWVEFLFHFEMLPNSFVMLLLSSSNFLT